MPDVTLSVARIAEIQNLHVRCSASGDLLDKAGQDLWALLREREALIESITAVEHERDTKLIQLEQALDTVGLLDQAVDALVAVAGCAPNPVTHTDITDALTAIQAAKDERNAYREALMQIAVDPEPDTREAMIDCAQSVLLEHLPEAEITARVDRVEAAMAARSQA